MNTVVEGRLYECVYVSAPMCVEEDQGRSWGKGSTGTFLSEGLILKMCLCGVLDTQGKRPSCWHFNICSASVFILF